MSWRFATVLSLSHRNVQVSVFIVLIEPQGSRVVRGLRCLSLVILKRWTGSLGVIERERERMMDVVNPPLKETLKG